MSENPYLISDDSHLRFRRDDRKHLVYDSCSELRSDAASNEGITTKAQCVVDKVFFPLVSVLIPKWSASHRLGQKSKKIVYLITGQGSFSQTNSSEQKISDNSTDETGQVYPKTVFKSS